MLVFFLPAIIFFSWVVSVSVVVVVVVVVVLCYFGLMFFFSH